MTDDVVTLYRTISQKELEVVAASEYHRWTPRLPEQPIFYPVANEEYAREISSQWNIPAGGVGFVTKFEVKKSFIKRYQIHKVGGKNHTEWWIPAEDLEELNKNIVGLIQIVGEYR